MLSIAQTVLETEGYALIDQAKFLTDDFTDTVDTLLNTKGRVIVSGMGKSGHVATKIASTLASTGTPAQVVHPAEASHGDLGMITKNDSVIILSNSGETKELSDLIAHCHRFDIPLVAITKNKDSTLAKASRHCILLTEAQEACPIGIAPTTSTTLCMALGDALAVSLMEARGFDKNDFLSYHPGGSLGARLLRVKAIMHTENLPIIDPDTDMREAILQMTIKGFGIGILSDKTKRVEAVITDGDLRRHYDDIFDEDLLAREIATYNPITISSDTLLPEALRIMNENGCTALVVVDDDFLVGLVHIHDLIRAGL